MSVFPTSCTGVSFRQRKKYLKRNGKKRKKGKGIHENKGKKFNPSLPFNITVYLFYQYTVAYISKEGESRKQKK